MTEDRPDFDSLWDYNQPAATETQFRALLPQAEAAGDPAYLAELLTQVARSEGLQRRFADAHRTLDRVERLLPAGRGRAQVRYLLERGRVHNSAGEPDRARPLFLAAWEQARAQGADFDAIDAAHMLALVVPPDAALAWNLQALDLTEATPDARAKKWLGALYNNIGWTYHDQGDYARALAVFEKGLAWREAANQPRETRIAQWTVARTLRSLGRVDEALVLQRTLEHAWARAGEADGYVYEELAECLLALGQSEAARPYFALAYDVLSKDPWLVEHEAARLQRLHDLVDSEN